MAAALPFVAAIGAGVSAYGQYKSGQDAKSVGKYNAKVAERDADQNELNSRTRLRKLMAEQIALYGKAGVDISQGSPVIQLALTAAEGEKEALSIRQGGQATAATEKLQGKAAAKAGTIGAVSTLLTGLGNAGSMYYGSKKV